MQLHGGIGAAPLDLGVHQLGRRRFLGGQLAAHMAGDAPVDMGPAHLQFGLERGEAEAGVLEIEHGGAKGLALAHKGQRLVKAALGMGLRGHRDGQALLRQLAHQVDEALVLLAEQVGDRHADILEE